MGTNVHDVDGLPYHVKLAHDWTSYTISSPMDAGFVCSTWSMISKTLLHVGPPMRHEQIVVIVPTERGCG
jgi:hypothetical protein